MKIRYNSQHLEFLRNGYKTMNTHDLTKAFNAQFALNKTEYAIKSTLKNHKIRSGRTGRFEPGRKPWNTGIKGAIKPNSGNFKKGHKPPNRRPLGSERICPKDGFILIKVAETDPHTGFKTRYKHKHRHVWENVHGPIPKNMVVAFKDGDKTNCDPENLMLISRAELLILNQHGYRKMPDELKPSVLAVTKLQVAISRKEKGL